MYLHNVMSSLIEFLYLSIVCTGISQSVSQSIRQSVCVLPVLYDC